MFKKILLFFRPKKRKSKFHTPPEFKIEMLVETIILLQEDLSRTRQELNYLPVHNFLESYQEILPPPRKSSLHWKAQQEKRRREGYPQFPPELRDRWLLMSKSK